MSKAFTLTFWEARKDRQELQVKEIPKSSRDQIKSVKARVNEDDGRNPDASDRCLKCASMLQLVRPSDLLDTFEKCGECEAKPELTFSHTFERGPMEIEFDETTGEVTNVNRGPARAKGIKAGDRIVRVGNHEFSKRAVDRAQDRATQEKNYTVTFQVDFHGCQTCKWGICGRCFNIAVTNVSKSNFRWEFEHVVNDFNRAVGKVLHVDSDSPEVVELRRQPTQALRWFKFSPKDLQEKERENMLLALQPDDIFKVFYDDNYEETWKVKVSNGTHTDGSGTGILIQGAIIKKKDDQEPQRGNKMRKMRGIYIRTSRTKSSMAPSEFINFCSATQVAFVLPHEIRWVECEMRFKYVEKGGRDSNPEKGWMDPLQGTTQEDLNYPVVLWPRWSAFAMRRGYKGLPPPIRLDKEWEAKYIEEGPAKALRDLSGKIDEGHLRIFCLACLKPSVVRQATSYFSGTYWAGIFEQHDLKLKFIPKREGDPHELVYWQPDLRPISCLLSELMNFCLSGGASGILETAGAWYGQNQEGLSELVLDPCKDALQTSWDRMELEDDPTVFSEKALKDAPLLSVITCFVKGRVRHYIAKFLLPKDDPKKILVEGIEYQKTFTFEPSSVKKLGLDYEDNGEVTMVHDDGQAKDKKIKEGSRIVKVGSVAWNGQALEGQEVTFQFGQDAKTYLLNVLALACAKYCGRQYWVSAGDGLDWKVGHMHFKKVLKEVACTFITGPSPRWFYLICCLCILGIIFAWHFVSYLFSFLIPHRCKVETSTSIEDIAALITGQHGRAVTQLAAICTICSGLAGGCPAEVLALAQCSATQQVTIDMI